jgi:uncharacterized protein (DUF779 family)
VSSGPAVAATPAALEVIRRLGAAHGPIVLHQSGGCCDGTAPMCVGREELPPGPPDVLLGHLAGVPFYIDAEQYERWGRPRFLIDVSPGDSGSFSLEGTEDVHFVTRTVTPAPTA